MKSFYPFLRIAALCLVVSMFFGCAKPVESEHKPKFYQSPMHPWIRSDKPGNCTICGMALVPVYEGDFELATNVIALPAATLQTIGVATAPVEWGPLKRSLRFAGRIDDDAGRHRFISAHFDGRVERPFIEQVGEEVRQGQPLAKIYSPELLYVVREYQGAIATKNKNISDVSARRLIQFGLTPGQLDALATQSHNQFGVDILSPITGTVITRYVNSGQYVKTGDPLFELGDFSKMWFLATAYESDLPFLHLGQTAKITTPSAPERVFEGVVTLIDPNFDLRTRSTSIRIEVLNPMVRTPHGERRELPHRAFGEAVIESQSADGLLVPRSAVLNTGDQSVVFVQKNEATFERRDVLVQAYGDHFARILDGLSPGERVVTSGNLLMDAESQMKNSAAPAVQPTPVVSSKTPEATRAAPDVMVPILHAIAAVGQALSKDDFPAYESGAKQLDADFPAPQANTPAEVQSAWAAVNSARHLHAGEASLASARAAYLPLSEAAADLVLALKKAGVGAATIDVFACPMTQSAFPGAPSKARWIQSSGPLRNPWFGPEMIDCGAKLPIEVAP